MLNNFDLLSKPASKGIRGYLIALALIAFALFLRLSIWPVETGLQYVTFFPAVALTAVLAGFWPGMFTSAMGVLFATFIFTAPYYSISMEVVYNSLWSNVVFMIDGLVVCFSIEAMHRFREKYAQELQESQAAHAQSEQNHQQFKSIVDNVLDGIIIINEAGIVTSFNTSASNIFGYHENEIVGKNISILMPEPDSSRHDGYIKNYLRTGVKKIMGTEREVNGLHKNGDLVPLELSVNEIKSKELQFCGVVRNISERKAREEYMFHLAHHDPLTSLPNRILFFDRLNQLIAKARRDQSKVALMFIDLDEFKEINDTLGHDIGDLLLVTATTRMKENLRDSDTAARIGGDEFVVLLPNIRTESDAMLVAEKIRKSLCQPYRLSGKTISISSSIGVVLYPEHGKDEHQLLKNADSAMYIAKERGRNCVVLFQSLRHKHT